MSIKTKKAFSLIEVVFVLVILGIVASLASQIIVQVYENYIMQRAIYRVSIQTEIVANQIVNRLAYRIKDSTIAKDHLKFYNFHKNGGPAPTNADWLPIKELPSAGTKYTAIEWIGYDNDSFASHANPNWSGFANYRDANKSEFITPASNLDNVATIMSNLSNNRVQLTQNRPAAVIFLQDDRYYTGSNEYNPLCMGMIPEDGNSTTDCIFPVKEDSNTSFKFVTTTAHPAIVPKIITERYKLAWSAYSIAPEDPDGDGLFDLVLYSNYQPWNGESYMDNTTTRHILMKNVSVFKFSESGGVIRFKLCATEQIGTDNNISTCKEKVIIK